MCAWAIAAGEEMSRAWGDVLYSVQTGPYHLEEVARQKEVLASSEQAQAAVESLAALRDRIADRLDSATPEDRRRVLEALDTRITVSETGGLDISIGPLYANRPKVSGDPSPLPSII